MARQPAGQLRRKTAACSPEFQLSDTEEIKRWIMSLGKHALVLEPEQLRAELETLLGAYGAEPMVESKAHK